MTKLVKRIIWGDRPDHDPDFEAAADQALARAQESNRRLNDLQQRLEVHRRR